jgi:thiamine-monophosphate kinase
MNAAARIFGVNIVGGDTARSRDITISIALIGEVEKRNLVLRSGAREGDAIFVTGTIGGSIKGKHLDFTPRVEEARALVKNFKISSMIDVSDGLFLDLGRILGASKVGARIYEDLVPVSDKADSFKKAVTDGEDFELLFTMSQKEAERFMRNYLRILDIPVSLIGEVTAKPSGFLLVDRSWKETRIREKGFLHF